MGENIDLLQHGMAFQQLVDANNKLAAENSELRGRPAWWFVTGLLVLGLYGGYRLGHRRALVHAAEACGSDCTEVLKAEFADKHQTNKVTRDGR